ncbi:MAG: class I SAM-dependent methyltransferase [Eggerthellaceae bacterium]|nr:class I SAM-dependent methyltransferase [Eggerthellaceae bacterium]
MDIQTAAQGIARYWDKRASSFDKDHDTEDLSAWKVELSRLLGYDRSKNVLDVGTGSGFIANMTSSLGFPTAGVDISEGMMRNGVRHAESQGVGTFFFKVPPTELPFMDSSVDAIVNCRLIWTMIASDSMVAEWMRILRPGGRVLCFNRLDPEQGLRHVEGKRFDYGDSAILEALDNDQATTAELIDLFERNGYEDVHVEHLPGLTRPEFDYQDWYVLCAAKPYPTRHRGELGMAAYWDEAAHRYDAGHMIGNIPAWHSVLSEFVGEEKDAKVLDVATGTGMIACALGECGYSDVTGIDLSERMMRVAIDRARQKKLDIPFVYGNAMELPCPNGSVDVVVSSRLLWTLSEPSAALRDWWRVLKPGGRIVAINEFEGDSINCPHMDAYCDSTCNAEFPWSNASKASMVQEAEGLGYQNVRFESMPGCRLADSDRENWCALIAEKPIA